MRASPMSQFRNARKWCCRELTKREKNSSQEQNIQTLENINGLQMFGFSSPAIVHATEALDPNHRLVEYWNHNNEKASLEMKDCLMSNASLSFTKAKLFG